MGPLRVLFALLRGCRPELSMKPLLRASVARNCGPCSFARYAGSRANGPRHSATMLAGLNAARGPIRPISQALATLARRFYE